jgi:hypothetical protein
MEETNFCLKMSGQQFAEYLGDIWRSGYRCGAMPTGRVMVINRALAVQPIVWFIGHDDLWLGLLPQQLE